MAALLAHAAVAAQETAIPAPANAPLWEAGLFGIAGSQQAYPGSSQHVKGGIVLPYLIYRGRWFRAEQGSVGLRAAKGERFELDVGFAGSFGSAPSDNDVRRGMPHIGTLVEFGPRLKWDLGDGPAAMGGGRWRVALPLRGVFDVNHSFDFRGIAFEPELAWGRRGADGWAYGASLGLLIGNRRLADTFYGVAPEFVTTNRPLYDAQAGHISTRLGLSLSKRIDDDWRVYATGRIDSVAGAANRSSPLVDRRTGYSIGIGFAWTWKKSSEPGQQ